MKVIPADIDEENITNSLVNEKATPVHNFEKSCRIKSNTKLVEK